MGWQTSDLCAHEKELAGGATEDRDRKSIDLSENTKVIVWWQLERVKRHSGRMSLEVRDRTRFWEIFSPTPEGLNLEGD